MESPKPITFEYEGKKYTLTYTRQSIKARGAVRV